MTIDVGVEIEFTSDDYIYLFDKLRDEKINFIFTGDRKYCSKEYLVIKPEPTVKGFELNIPPNTTYDTLEKICDIFKDYTIMNDYCAIHIHYPIDDEKWCDKISNYYINNEEKILDEAKNLVTNLNKKNNDRVNKNVRSQNMNIFTSYTQHKTVEHRIYKSTFNYKDICFMINQTKEIIKNALEE